MTGAWRRTLLTLYRAAGSAHRRASYGWGPVLRWVFVVSLALLVLPWAVAALAGLMPGVWTELGVGRPHVANLWSVTNVLAVSAVILALRWLVQARERVVVEGFVDYTTDDGQAVKGLATLLIAELSRMHELYGRVNDELSTPLSVGAKARGGAGPGTHPGAFLSVSADEVGGLLNDAVATETTVAFAGVRIPIGFVLSLVGRLARGPRIVGSLHNTEAGGGPTLTAQIVGRGQAQQWRVDAMPPAGASAADAAYLDPMVAELACRMFGDLTLRGSVRWRAVRAFTQYLELYWESYRTPRERAGKLEAAEDRLLEAIAEDEGFDLGYYNLGVVYSQLADTERAAVERSDYVKPGDRPHAAYTARLDAALAAFNRAVALNRDRAEAVYALAVHEYTRTGACDRSVLDAIVCRCERVLELDPAHAQAHDLRGIALLGVGRVRDSQASHRAAVARSWRRLLRTEFGERAAPPSADSMLPGARANLATALRNLADVDRVGADQHDHRRWRLVRAERLYAQACELASGDTKAATLRAHGQMLESLGDAERARERYEMALKIDPENPVYWAHLAGAFAAAATDFAEAEAKARRHAEAALDELAPIYRRTLELHASHASVALRESTLNALERTYAMLADDAAVARIRGLRRLRLELEGATRRRDVGLLLTLKARYPKDRHRELEQVQIALARTLGRQGRWPEAVVEYERLIAMLEHCRPHAIHQHSLHAKHARALRNMGRLQDALVAAARGQVQDPLSASVRREVGKAHFALHQYEEALEAWRQTLWLTPNDPYLHWKVAFCHWSVAQERTADAARRAALLDAAAGFGQAATLFGVRSVEGWAWSQLWAGRTCQQLGEPDAAVRHLRSAAGCAPTAVPARLLLGEVYRAAGDAGASRLQLEAALDALAAPGGRLLDADWGETLTDREAAVRAGVALARLEADETVARACAAAARSVAAEVEDPAVRARCDAALAELDAPPLAAVDEPELRRAA